VTAFQTGRSVLTVLNDASRAAMYSHLAELAGVTVVQADGALHALTQLERTPVDAIICDAQMTDMSGAEFRSILEDDALTGGVPIYLIGEDEDGAPGWPTSSAGPQVLAEALEALGVDDSAYPLPLRATARPQLSGQLEPFSLSEFLNWAAELACSGHWLITVSAAGGPPSSGHLAMSAGRLTYAEFAGRAGRGAVLELLRHSDHCGGQFRFYHCPSLPPGRQTDLSGPTNRLLMELAVDLDERAASQP
jgi:CheY-like chemotaxis protein